MKIGLLSVKCYTLLSLDDKLYSAGKDTSDVLLHLYISITILPSIT